MSDKIASTITALSPLIMGVLSLLVGLLINSLTSLADRVDESMIVSAGRAERIIVLERRMERISKLHEARWANHHLNQHDK